MTSKRKETRCGADARSAVQQLWQLTAGARCVDRDSLSEVLRALPVEGLDWRTSELARASALALAGRSTESTEFPSLRHRVGSPVKKDTVLQYLRELGSQLSEPARIVVGGSSALILAELLSRNTEDIDLVDEVPASLRALHAWRTRAQERYGLYLAHFQSHYLPRDWGKRLSSLGQMGRLEAFLVDPLDILVGKLFSRREKDLDDLREALPKVSLASFHARLEFADRLADDPKLLEQARKNHDIVLGQALEEHLRRRDR